MITDVSIINLREKFSPGPRFKPRFTLAQWVARLVRAPARRSGDPGLNSGPGENFSLKLLIYDLPDGYSGVSLDQKRVNSKDSATMIVLFHRNV